MIVFRRVSIFERLVYAILPKARARRDASVRSGIKALMNDPSLPCEVDGHFIPNGYGLDQLKLF